MIDGDCCKGRNSRRDARNALAFVVCCLLVNAIATTALAGHREQHPRGQVETATPTERTQTSTLPNIVWLISEDNSKHFLRRFDPSGAATPQIDALAKHGVSFRHAFSNAPVCSVARTTLMTGCFAPRIGTQFHRADFKVPLPNDLQMFPYYLRQAGYYTSNRQKKDYNAIEGNGVWDESSRNATWRNRAADQPFFHMQSFATTHESSLHFSRKQYETQKTQTDPQSVSLSPKHPATDLFRYSYARYHDRIREVDQQIGDVIRMLESDGLLEETFIFYFGDHGGVLPGSKGYLYETGLHVPFVVRVPDRFQHFCPLELGSFADGFVSFVDFAPTVLRLAGLETPEEMDGQSFLGESITAAQIENRRRTIGYADRFDERSELVRSLRQGKWKYIRNYQAYVPDGMQNNYRYRMLAYQQWRSLYGTGELDSIRRQFFEPKPAEMLFDLEADPYETRNLANDSAMQDKLIELRRELDQMLRSWPDLSFFPEYVLASEAVNGPTEFGQQQAARIGRLIDAANLGLLPASQRQSSVIEALQSDDPWIRLWAIRACTSNRINDAQIAQPIESCRQQDRNRLVRVAAEEYIALEQDAIAAGLLQMQVELHASEIPLEAASILNSMAILVSRMSAEEFLPELDLATNRLRPQVRNHDSVKRRLEYFQTLIAASRRK